MYTVCVIQCFPFMFFLPESGNTSNNQGKKNYLQGISFNNILFEGCVYSVAWFPFLKPLLDTVHQAPIPAKESISVFI